MLPMPMTLHGPHTYSCWGIQYILINLNFVLGGLTSTLDSLMNNFYIKCYILWRTLHKLLMLPTKENTQTIRLTQTLSALLMFS